jgi:hypothetical protein
MKSVIAPARLSILREGCCEDMCDLPPTKRGGRVHHVAGPVDLGQSQHSIFCELFELEDVRTGELDLGTMGYLKLLQCRCT